MTKEIDSMIIHSLDKLDTKIDKIEDSVNQVKNKVAIVEERQRSEGEAHHAHEQVASHFKVALEQHINSDNEVQARIFSELKIYNKLLDTHIEGVQTLKQLHQQNAEKISLYKEEMNNRLNVLEEPIKAKAYLYKKYIKIGGFLTLTSAIIVAISKLSGLF